MNKTNQIEKQHPGDNPVELYNRDMSDMLGDAPNWLIHTGSYLLYTIIALLLLGTSLFSYPDVVKTTVLIDDLANVEWVVANSTGNIDRFFVEDQSLVEVNDTVAVIKNAASLDDLRIFCRLLTDVEWYYRTNDSKYIKEYRFDLILGEMSGAYEQFTEAVRNCYREEEENIYKHRTDFLNREITILKRDQPGNELAVLRVERELFELSAMFRIEHERNKKQLEIAYEKMVNSIRSWESKYLIKSKSKGKIVMGQSWAVSNMVNTGDTICSILSENDEKLIGRIRLSQDQVTGVTIGNKVNIELSKYPAHTYGYILGEVAFISYVPYNRTYSVELTLSEPLLTTLKREIHYEIGLQGRAEIITSSRSVLSRIFTPLYEIFK